MLEPEEKEGTRVSNRSLPPGIVQTNHNLPAALRDRIKKMCAARYRTEGIRLTSSGFVVEAIIEHIKTLDPATGLPWAKGFRKPPPHRGNE